MDGDRRGRTDGGGRTGRGRAGIDRLRYVGVVALVVLVALAGCSGYAGIGLQPADPNTARTAGSGGGSGGTNTGPPSRTGTRDPPGTPTPGDETATETPAGLPPAGPLEGTRSLAEADVTVRGTGADELGYGAAVGDVNGDGLPDLLVGAPFHNATATQSGAVFVFFGPVGPGDLTVDDADVRLPGEANGDWAGNSIAVADVNTDGVGDLIVGAPRNGAGGDEAGAVYVVHGGTDLPGRVPLGAADAKFTGPGADAFAGYSVDAADLTGGPAADLVIGAPRASVGAPRAGAAYLVDGRTADGTGSLSDAAATLVGEGADDRAGRSVAVAGDVNGDDHPDLVIGARRANGTAPRSGAAYIVTGGSFPERSSLADAAVTLEGANANDDAGFAVARAGDLTSDGHADVLVGAPLNDAGGHSAGAVYVVHGGSDLPGTMPLADASRTLLGAPGDHAGYAVGGAGDVTCDGTPDVLVGAPWNDAGGDNAGAAYLVAGGGTGVAALTNATATLTGAAAGDQVGRVDALVAVRGAETSGLVVGAPFGAVPQTAHVVYAGCHGSGG